MFPLSKQHLRLLRYHDYCKANGKFTHLKSWKFFKLEFHLYFTFHARLWALKGFVLKRQRNRNEWVTLSQRVQIVYIWMYKMCNVRGVCMFLTFLCPLNRRWSGNNQSQHSVPPTEPIKTTVYLTFFSIYKFLWQEICYRWTQNFSSHLQQMNKIIILTAQLILSKEKKYNKWLQIINI